MRRLRPPHPVDSSNTISLPTCVSSAPHRNTSDRRVPGSLCCGMPLARRNSLSRLNSSSISGWQGNMEKGEGTAEDHEDFDHYLEYPGHLPCGQLIECQLWPFCWLDWLSQHALLHDKYYLNHEFIYLQCEVIRDQWNKYKWKFKEAMRFTGEWNNSISNLKSNLENEIFKDTTWKMD